MKKTLEFIKKLPGIDPLIIALLGHFNELLLINDQHYKEKFKIFEKEKEIWLKKKIDLENKIEDCSKKQDEFLQIFEILREKGLNIEEALKKGFSCKENSSCDDESLMLNKNKIKGKATTFSLQENIKNEDFADESLINDSEESSFNYFGKPESPSTSNRLKAISPNLSHKGKVYPSIFKLNLKGIHNSVDDSFSSDDFSSKNTKKKNCNKENYNNCFKKKL